VPGAVRVILLDGGINDVDLRKIVDPATTQSTLDCLIDQHCHGGMRRLLEKVVSKFTHPDCRIIVTGYYQILSEASYPSSPTSTIRFLEMLGVAAVEDLLARGGFGDVVNLCHRFRTQSDSALATAVSDADDPRVKFVASGFTEQNALFQPNSLLSDFEYLESDPFAGFRREVCPSYYGDQVVGNLFCRCASVGHPTANGASKYADQIMSAFS
jgi:hypothetical protein